MGKAKKPKSTRRGGSEITAEITATTPRKPGDFAPGDDPRRGKGGKRPGAGRKPAEVNEIRRQLIRDGDKARLKLLHLMNHSPDHKVVLAAAREILAHAVGRPKQGIEVDATNSPLVGPEDEPLLVARARQLGLHDKIPSAMLEREKRLALIASPGTIASVVAVAANEDDGSEDGENDD